MQQTIINTKKLNIVQIKHPIINRKSFQNPLITDKSLKALLFSLKRWKIFFTLSEISYLFPLYPQSELYDKKAMMPISQGYFIYFSSR